MYTRIISYPKTQSFFLFGPRGAGKSFWTAHEFKKATTIDLLKAQTFNELTGNPSRLEEMIPDKGGWVIIDEIQKIPSLLDEVHRLIEKRKIRFILTGSSARKLRRHGVNLLAGRALTRYMHPLTVKELGKDFQLKKSLQYGHLPMAYTTSSPEDYLHAYVKTHIKEEIIQEGIIRNLMGFSRFLEAASFSQGQPLNISKVASEASVDRKVTEEYFRVLEDLLLAVRLPVLTRKSKRKPTKHPKFFFIDTGIFQTIRPRGTLDSEEEREGAALETLIFQELRALNDYHQWDFNFFTWGISNGPDVDLVLYGKKGLIAIEVKRSGRLRSGELEGLKAFQESYPNSKRLFIYGGQESRVIEKCQIIPFERFLIQPELFLF